MRGYFILIGGALIMGGAFVVFMWSTDTESNHVQRKDSLVEIAPSLLNPKTTYLYSNSSLTLDEVFFKKEIHNEIFDRLNNFIGDMIIKEGVNWNLLSQRY